MKWKQQRQISLLHVASERKLFLASRVQVLSPHSEKKLTRTNVCLRRSQGLFACCDPTHDEQRIELTVSTAGVSPSGLRQLHTPTRPPQPLSPASPHAFSDLTRFRGTSFVVVVEYDAADRS